VVTLFYFSIADLKDYGLNSTFSPYYTLLTVDPHQYAARLHSLPNFRSRGSDFAIEYLHNMSLGVVRRLTIMTFEKLTKPMREEVRQLIDGFSFKESGFAFSQRGFRVDRYYYFL